MESTGYTWCAGVAIPPASKVAEAAQKRGTELPAARMGLAMRSVRTTALRSNVLKADRRLAEALNW
jgi:hypothetical protein